MKSITITCSESELNTIYSALRIELERNWGGDPDVVEQLKDAMKAVQSAKMNKGGSK